MDELAIGGDDHRILTYARLVDPEVWPESGEPDVTPVTATRLRRSIEAGYRIASHEGGVADPTDAVARLCLCYGLSEPVFTLPTLPGLDPARIAALALLLQGEESEHRSESDDEARRTDEPGDDKPDDEVVFRMPAKPSEDVAEDSMRAETEPAIHDYNHDAESGIDYVGDPDDEIHQGDDR